MKIHHNDDVYLSTIETRDVINFIICMHIHEYTDPTLDGARKKYF
jgi:hypothetical protein